MNRKIFFSISLKEKFNTVDYNANQLWKNINIHNTDELINKIIYVLNEKYPKLNISECQFKEKVEVYGESSTYFGVIENEEGIIEAYVFIIPPAYETRSGILAQQVFPVISGIMPKIKNSKDKKISNRPIYIINANEANYTPSMAINIRSGEILDFKYVDIFNKSIEEILREKNLKENANNILEYNEWLVKTNKDKQNEFFEIDDEKKIIKYLIIRLKDGIHINNEPYWFVLKAYASFYLASRDAYKCDMSIFNQLPRGNKTLDAFRDYIERFI